MALAPTIGPYALRNPYILAPMAGVSEMPFRLLALRMGAALAPTELVSAAGLLHASIRTLKYLRHDAERERPFVVQIFGGDPEQMKRAAAVAAEMGAHVLDINMGCPVPKVTKNGAGSALLCDPQRAGQVVEAVRAGSGLPVTAKIRSGWDATRINAVEVGRSLEQAGAAAVALHPRTRAQGYAGRADWSHIRALKQALRIPVIGNGDVRTPADATRMQAETGCDFVMIGRGALGAPWIFRELLGGPAPSPEERCAVVLEHFDAHLAFVGDEKRAVHQFRKSLLWYAHGLRGASAFRTLATQLDRADEVRRACEAFFVGAENEARAVPAELELDYRGALG